MKFRMEAVPGREAQPGKSVVLMSGDMGERGMEKTLLR